MAECQLGWYDWAAYMQAGLQWNEWVYSVNEEINKTSFTYFSIVDVRQYAVRTMNLYV